MRQEVVDRDRIARVVRIAPSRHRRRLVDGQAPFADEDADEGADHGLGNGIPQ